MSSLLLVSGANAQSTLDIMGMMMAMVTMKVTAVD